MSLRPAVQKNVGLSPSPFLPDRPRLLAAIHLIWNNVVTAFDLVLNALMPLNGRR